VFAAMSVERLLENGLIMEPQTDAGDRDEVCGRIQNHAFF